MIKAVIFDIDGVLLDSFKANTEFISALMVKFGHAPIDEEKYKGLFHVPLIDLIKIFSHLEEKEKIEEIYQVAYRREVAYPVHLLKTPDSLPEIIKSLSEDYALGVVTSRGLNAVYEAKQLSDLKKYFLVTVSYEDTENHKPYPEPLLLAAEKLNLKPAECVYVGDSESDMIAARAAGMKIIIYSKNVFKEADASISVFSELPSLIKKL